MAIVSAVSCHSQQSLRHASKIPKIKYFSIFLLQLTSAIVKSNFNPSSVTSFSAIYMSDSPFQSAYLLYLYSCCVCCYNHLSSHSRPKTFTFTPCLCSAYLVPPGTLGECLSWQWGRGGPISWNLLSSQLLNGNKVKRQNTLCNCPGNSLVLP